MINLSAFSHMAGRFKSRFSFTSRYSVALGVSSGKWLIRIVTHADKPVDYASLDDNEVLQLRDILIGHADAPQAPRVLKVAIRGFTLRIPRQALTAVIEQVETVCAALRDNRGDELRAYLREQDPQRRADQMMFANIKANNLGRLQYLFSEQGIEEFGARPNPNARRFGDRGELALACAAKQATLAMMEFMVSQGALCNPLDDRASYSNYELPLPCAVESRDRMKVQLLLANQADVDARFCGFWQGGERRTALVDLVADPHPRPDDHVLMRDLIALNPTITEEDKRIMAEGLVKAAEYSFVDNGRVVNQGLLDNARVILELVGDPGEAGVRALMTATARKDVAMVALLREAGVDPSQPSRDGVSACDVLDRLFVEAKKVHEMAHVLGAEPVMAGCELR